MISLGQIAILAIGTWTATRLALLDRHPVPVAVARHRRRHLRRRRADRPAGAPAQRPVPGSDHADGGRRRERRADHDRLPERRRRLHRPHRRPSTSRGWSRSAGPASPRATPRYYRYVIVVCALMFLLIAAHFAGKPGRAWASIRESEPAALAAGVNIVALQALGVRSGLVHHRRGRLPAGCAGRPAERLRIPDSGLTHAARGGPDRRHLLALGRRRGRRLQPARALSLPGAVGHRPELPPDHLRRRPAAGPVDGSRWPRRADAQGRREPGAPRPCACTGGRPGPREAS